MFTDILMSTGNKDGRKEIHLPRKSPAKLGSDVDA
jgi:hypothetical protein